MSDKWKGLERIAENVNFGMTNADQHLAILAREFGPLLDAVGSAEKLLRAMNRSDTNKILEAWEKFK